MLRIQEYTRILAHGGRRSDCCRYGEETWGISWRASDELIRQARQQLRDDFDIERPQLIAELLSRYATIEQEARAKGHLHIALGAANATARLAQLIS